MKQSFDLETSTSVFSQESLNQTMTHSDTGVGAKLSDVIKNVSFGFKVALRLFRKMFFWPLNYEFENPRNPSHEDFFFVMFSFAWLLITPFSLFVIGSAYTVFEFVFFLGLISIGVWFYVQALPLFLVTICEPALEMAKEVWQKTADEVRKGMK